MNILDIIEKKKRGQELTKDEIEFVIKGVVAENGDPDFIPDYQLSALLMAIVLKGMTDVETANLTMAMTNSGDTLDLSFMGRTILDKHSTGGVGDKTTLIVGPIMSSLGVPIAKMSGRGLGITGGTIDKLESIPGFTSSISEEQFINNLKTIGNVDAAQTKSLAPADKRLYALRDVTATIDSLPLIASSIMSKKLASGADSIVLDVKCGNGAFMKNKEDASMLASTMIDIGEKCGRKCSAVISDMNIPLGRCVGNKLEVMEAVDFLKDYKSSETRLRNLMFVICREMFRLSDKYEGNSDEEITAMISSTLEEGRAYDYFLKLINAQGGDVSRLEEVCTPSAKYNTEIVIPDIISSLKGIKDDMKNNASDMLSGKALSADVIGRTSLALGAGRMTKEDTIDTDAGIVIDILENGNICYTLYSNSKEKLEDGKAVIEKALISYINKEELSENLVADRNAAIIYDIIRK